MVGVCVGRLGSGCRPTAGDRANHRRTPDPERLELGAGLAALHPEEREGNSGVAEYRNLAAIGTARYPERDGI